MEQLGIVMSPEHSGDRASLALIAYVSSMLSEGIRQLRKLPEEDQKLVLEALELTILETHPQQMKLPFPD